MPSVGVDSLKFPDPMSSFTSSSAMSFRHRFPDRLKHGLESLHTRSHSFTSLSEAAQAARSSFKDFRDGVSAEANEFIQCPHLMFTPIKLTVAVMIPFVIPLLFMPVTVLLLYLTASFFWYLTLVSYFASEVALRPPWYKTGLPLEGTPSYWKSHIHNPWTDSSLNYEDVEFTSINGTLRGWFIPGQIHVPCVHKNKLSDDHSTTRTHSASSLLPSPSPQQLMVVFVHGAGRDRRAFSRHAEVIARQGLSCLLFDLSEHGFSDSNKRGFAFGMRERFDVVAAVQYMRQTRNANKVVVIGTSAGAVSAILAAQLRPDIIDKVVAENPYTRPGDLFIEHLDDTLSNYLSQNTNHVWRKLFYHYASRVLLFRIGLYFNRGALDVVSKLECPLLVLHGTGDIITPFMHGQKIVEAAGKDKALFWPAKGAAHCALFDQYPNEWAQIVLHFIKSDEIDKAHSVIDENKTF